VIASGHASGGPPIGRSIGGWCRFAFVGVIAGQVVCGGSVVSKPANDGGADTGDATSDAARHDQACSHNLVCLIEGGGLNSPGGHDAGMSPEVSAGFNGGTLCAYHTGPIEPGQDAGGPVMQCSPTFVCVNLDKGWACCSVEGGGGASICLPFGTDGN
jgi:hypothetical protein